MTTATGLCFWPSLSGLTDHPSGELLRYMAGIGATLLVAYAIEVSTVVRANYARRARLANWVGAVVGVGSCGLVAILVSLALAERADVRHWGRVDDGVMAFAAGSLTLLGISIVLMPLLHYEWLHAPVEEPDDD